MATQLQCGEKVWFCNTKVLTKYGLAALGTCKNMVMQSQNVDEV